MTRIIGGNMPRTAVPGIFCIEGPWDSRLTNTKSVKPLLEFLEDSEKVRHVHERVTSRDELPNIVRKWPQHQYQRYSVGWFAFHGSPGCLHVGRHKITLVDLAEELRGACAGKLLYFGGCGVLDVPGREIAAFRRATRARCIAGYREDADWYPVAGFELVLMEALTLYRRADAVHRWLTDQYPDLVDKLGFKMHYGSVPGAG
jgi:hypothetical protein